MTVSKDWISETRIWKIIKKLGIDPIIRKIYWKIKLSLNSHRQKEIKDNKAVFKTTNRYDWNRANDLIGEEEVAEDILVQLHKDEIFYDIGAAVGTYSCFAGQKIQNGGGHVVAFEPTSTNYRRLEENIVANSLESVSTLSRYALSNKDGIEEMSLAGREAGQGGHSIINESEGEIEVETRRGDTLVTEGFPSPDVVKIDVEGAELQVLQGFVDILDNIRLIYCELHPTRIPNIESDVKQYLQTRGFKIEDIGTSRVHIRATNTDIEHSNT